MGVTTLIVLGLVASAGVFVAGIAAGLRLTRDVPRNDGDHDPY